MSDIIRREDAMGAVQDHFNADGFKGYDDGQKMMYRIKALPSVKPIQTRNCDGCDIFNMAEELAMASIDACADEIVRQFKDRES